MIIFLKRIFFFAKRKASYEMNKTLPALGWVEKEQFCGYRKLFGFLFHFKQKEVKLIVFYDTIFENDLTFNDEPAMPSTRLAFKILWG